MLKTNKIQNKFILISRLVTLSEKSNLSLCHWKSNMRLKLSMLGISDFDFSIPISQKKKFISILKKLNFIEFYEPSYSSYHGVSNWLGIDFKNGIIYHIHLHTRLLTGSKFIKEQDLPWLMIMNKNLIKDKKTKILIPTPNLEYLLLLIRESVKFYSTKEFVLRLTCKKNFINAETIKELEWLWNRTKKNKLNYFGHKFFGSENWNKISQKISFNIIKNNQKSFKLLAKEIYKSIKNFRSNYMIYNNIKYIFIYFWFKIVNIYEYFWRKTSIKKRTKKNNAIFVVIIGADGTGKTTLLNELHDFFIKKIDIQKIYLGSFINRKQKIYLGSFINRKKKKNLHKLISQTLKSLVKTKFMKYFIAIINAYARLYYITKTKKYINKGIIVISDRFPQTEFTNFYDSPLLKRGNNFVNNFFYLHEKYIYNKFKNYHPDLVIKLTSNLKTLKRRRSDYDINLLEKKQKLVNSLKFKNSKIIKINTQVCSKIKTKNIAAREIWNVLIKKNY